MHWVPNGGVLKIAPPNFSFINLTDFCKYKDFFKKLNAHNFFNFKARLLIFWVIGHANDLVTWYDWHNDWTRVSPVLGCGSFRPTPMKIPRSNTPWLIGLNNKQWYLAPDMCFFLVTCFILTVEVLPCFGYSECFFYHYLFMCLISIGKCVPVREKIFDMNIKTSVCLF